MIDETINKHYTRIQIDYFVENGLQLYTFLKNRKLVHVGENVLSKMTNRIYDIKTKYKIVIDNRSTIKFLLLFSS